jgi:hypothetical protein
MSSRSLIGSTLSTDSEKRLVDDERTLSDGVRVPGDDVVAEADHSL